MRALLWLALLASAPLAAAGEKSRLPPNAAYQAECGSCHVPYPPRLLPGSSWRQIVARLDRHFGADASLIMDPATTYYENSLVMDGGGQPRRELGAGNPGTQFAAQLDGFSDAARANRPHTTPGEMGLRDIRLIEAMYRSADAGGVPIDV